MKIVYLDNNATTRIAPEVVEAMLPVLRTDYGNPSSLHLLGNAAHDRIEKSRTQVAQFLGARPGEIIFTSGGTESNHLALCGALEARPHKRHLIITEVEHPCIRALADWLAERRDYRVTRIHVDRSGRLDLNELKKAIRPDTALVSVMWANNETGVLMPVEEAAHMAHEKGALFHTDAVQAAGKVSVDVAKVDVDLLSISGHKLHAPKGVGALFVRRGVRIRPQMVGGHQENGRRGGTENVASIVGLGKACELSTRSVSFEQHEVRGLRDRLEQGMIENIPDIDIVGQNVPRVPNTICVNFDRVEGESVLLFLSEHHYCQIF